MRPTTQTPCGRPGLPTGRPHGRAKYIREGCHCDICSAASRAYDRNRARRRAYGYLAYVDAAPARRHIEALRQAGIGHKRIAFLAGVSTGVLSKLLYGDRSRGMAPSRRIRPETERKLLAIEIGLDSLADAVPIDAIGTHRRIQALATVGWSQRAVAARLGMDARNFARLLTADRVAIGTYRRVRTLYEQMSNQSPRTATPHEKSTVSRVQNLARLSGWAPPAAWDEDTIDDSAAEPEGTNVDRAPRLGLPPDEDLLWLAETETIEVLADRFKVRIPSVKTALRRAQEKAA